MLKTRTWIIVLTAAAILLAAATCHTLSAKRAGSVVLVLQDGVVLREIDLSRVAEAYAFTVDAPDGGYNVVSVEPGRIRVADADCPDQVCVRQGWLSDQATPVVCAPHRLVIALKGTPDADAATR